MSGRHGGNGQAEGFSWEFVAERRRKSWFDFSAGRSSGGSSTHHRVVLPHCWNRFDSFYDGADYRRGFGSYRCRFELRESEHEWGQDSRFWLEVGGFYGSAQVFLNGRRLGRHEGNYLGFRLEVTDHVRVGENRLGFLVENRHRRGRLPGRADPDFLLYGGLAGHCQLSSTGRVAFSRFGPRTSTEVDEAGDGRLELDLEDCSTDSVDASARWRLLDEGGNLLGEGGAADRLWCGTTELWSPESPTLYRLQLELQAPLGGVAGVSDRRERLVGFRSARFSDDGFELNGSRYLLHGMNRHESLPGFGSALPDSVHRFDARQLREFGCNSVRLSHYPQSPAFLDACDRLGLFVYAEVCSWKTVNAGAWLRAARVQFDGLVRRDRHRPAVLVWGMGNESRSAQAYRVLRDDAARLDPTRATCYAENHLYRAKRKATVGLPDVWGINYELDVHEEASAASRSGAVLFTECMNHCLEEDPLGTLPPGPGKQLEVIERDLSIAAQSRSIAGYFAWCYADYATLYRRRFRRQAGLFEASRRPRPAAWLFRSRHRPNDLKRNQEPSAAGPAFALRLSVVEDLGDAIVMRAEVCDELSQRVDYYQGELMIETEGFALRCERAESTTLHGPEAWFWLEAENPARAPGDEGGRIVASCRGLQAVSFAFGPLEGRPDSRRRERPTSSERGSDTDE